MTVNLESVDINNCNKITEFFKRSEGGSFPNLSFLTFAITHKYKNSILFFIKFHTRSKTRTDRESLSQRTSGNLHTRKKI